MVEGKNISGSITVQASNVVIRNDCVTSSDIYPVHFVSGSNLTVEDTTITGTGHGCDRAVEPAGNGAVMNGLNVSGCEDGIQMYDNDVLENSFIHDLAFTSSSHNDGVQQNGGHNDVVRHNTIFNPHNQTSCVNFTTDFGGISGITITGNLLNGGNYTVTAAAAATVTRAGSASPITTSAARMCSGCCRRTARSPGAATSPTPAARRSASKHRSRPTRP